ncbi:hypothetical protein F5X99DRAFT_402388 [Biscogniauxia marginata]|nr:hypothetical protein F5X99DRAFT_402388 [Biscogniauxia marginata]
MTSSSTLHVDTFEYDANSIDTPLVQFIQRFYSLADDLSRIAEWASCFAANASLKRGAAEIVGREAILQAAISGSKDLASRQHNLEKVFAFAPGKPDDIMLYGKATTETKDGARMELETAGRIHLIRNDDGSILIDLYQLYPILPPKAL